MTRFILAAGVAALAISAPAASKPGGNGGGHGPAAAQEHGGGHGGQEQIRGGGRAKMQARAEARGPDRAQARMAQRNQEVRARHAERVRDVRKDQAHQIREARKEQAHQIREARKEQAHQIREARSNRVERLRDVQNIRDLRPVDEARFADRGPVGFGVGGCPPGLAKKPVACMPPGQAKKLLGARAEEARRIAAMNELPLRLQSLYPNTPDYYYRYGNGYVYQVNRTNDVISSLLPLFGLGYNVGQPFPASYGGYGLPMAYQPFYPQTPYADYRYANGYVYQVDPYTGLIQDVDPMLGYGYGYGQMMPMTYSAYNVPYQYRPLYYDTSDAYYRYAPGAIYQVDPTTSLITAVAALLSPNSLAVGQPLPVGYSAYNVPYDYRANYYDTPNDWYRYSNGYIYRVDPATQLVTALVASVLT